MIVLDASAALSGLLNAGPARESPANEQVHVPHLVDSEVPVVSAAMSPRGASLPTTGGPRCTPGVGSA